MHKILGLLTLLGALSWASTSWAMESIHGGTCWIERQGDTLKVVSFNDRQAEFWNSFSLGEQVREALASVKVLAQGEVTISMACSDLGHRLVIRGASVQNQRFCLYTDMKFSSFELYGDQGRGADCRPYVLGELLIYEPDDELRGKALEVLIRREHRKDIKALSVDGSVVTLKLQPHWKFAEVELLKVLRSTLPEGVAVMLNEAVGFPSEQSFLMRYLPSPKGE